MVALEGYGNAKEALNKCLKEKETCLAERERLMTEIDSLKSQISILRQAAAEMPEFDRHGLLC